MITASNPENFISAGKYPPPCASPIQPVSGDFATEVKRLCPEIGVPVTTPVHKARTLSGLKGSTPAGVSLRT